jgi:hypothetical protein
MTTQRGQFNEAIEDIKDTSHKTRYKNPPFYAYRREMSDCGSGGIR